ncbi:hypothetical protein TRFO_32548 [Tritrichomonas foetus]|uniref:Regulator of chromosome condensation protein n=1 Tax=Tritrichomonas foetus TaxID=1144522 RepID=A0A1J4JNH8_9EUKA|nr:hypothetical protein TRFO_32548 [Tritrichomonas foetus]|eukprot:OHT00687.1 hypothetical protein TRFO_32548 [Tritrichomonas foetus]
MTDTISEPGIYASGLNDHGQIGIVSTNGNNRVESVLSPTMFNYPPGKIVCIACGYDHSVFVYDNGSVYAVGDDHDFIIGTRESEEYRLPVKVDLPEPIIWATCGWYYTCYLSANGSLYYCSKELKNQQYHITEAEKLVYVTGNTKEPAAIDVMGDIYFYQVDPRKKSTKHHLPLPVYDLVTCKKFNLALTVNHVLYGNLKLNQGSSEFAPILDLNGVIIRQIFGYFQFAGALSEDGNVYFYGDNNYGQLACGATHSRNVNFTKVTSIPEPVQFLAVGQSHSAFVTETGDLYTCGYNNQGQLMIDSKDDKNTPVKTVIEKATNVSCGDNFTFVTIGIPTFIHPGMKHFNMLAKTQNLQPTVQDLHDFLNFTK